MTRLLCCAQEAFYFCILIMEEKTMYLYNSLSHKKELFVPNNPDLVKMYTCGPTVYHFAHIGILRTYIMEDVLE